MYGGFCSPIFVIDKYRSNNHFTHIVNHSYGNDD